MIPHPPPGYRLLKDGENVPVYYAYFYEHKWHKRRRYGGQFKYSTKYYFPFARKLRIQLTSPRQKRKFGA